MRASRVFSVTAGTILCLLITTGLANASTYSTASPYGCKVDVYWLLDAYGNLTAYPSAVCGGSASQEYHGISIYAIFTAGGADDSLTRYSDALGLSPGVYSGKGIVTENRRGSNRYCAKVTVGWNAYGQIHNFNTVESCVYK